MPHPKGYLDLYRFIYMYIANSLEIKSSSHEPLARMLFKLAWSILGAKGFKLVQMKCPGSQISPPQKGAKKRNFFKNLLLMNQ